MNDLSFFFFYFVYIFISEIYFSYKIWKDFAARISRKWLYYLSLHVHDDDGIRPVAHYELFRLSG